MNRLVELPITKAQFEKIFEILNEFIPSKLPVRNQYSKEKSWKVSGYKMDGEIFVFSIWFMRVRLNHGDRYEDVTYTYRILPDGDLEGTPEMNGSFLPGW